MGDRVQLVGHFLGQYEHRALDVGEVLVEGRRRRADRTGDVDHSNVANGVRLQ
jgi:hypothetical protein